MMKQYELETPCYLIDEGKLIQNLEVLQRLQEETGCHVLLAQKAFSAFYYYPLIGQYISGTTSSGLYEAKLGFQEMGLENHVFSPAYRDRDFDEIASICSHVIFNSFAQFEKFKSRCGTVSVGIRINPEFSTQAGHAIYDPCAPGSRLGVTIEQFRPDLFEEMDGLHFHTLCEQNSDDFAATLKAVEEKFGPYLHRCKWVNIGGGHHITRSDYDLELLKQCILHLKETYHVQVYVEPGEAVALNAGYFITEILDIVKNGEITNLILDGSAACHMPDVLEMPYRPPLQGGALPGEKPYTYRLSSCTCLAGDVIGDYSFDHELHIGDRLCFEDMAIYSMVKNNTFNGIPLPQIAGKKPDGRCEIIKQFGYEDFKCRLS